jgi:hypothetical protein
VEAHGDSKTRDWEAAGEPSAGFYVNRKGDIDGGDARGRYGAASLTGDVKNRNLNPEQF